MTLSLYRASAPVFLRGLHTLSELLKKGEAHAAAHGLDPAELIGARLAPDMLPLSKQVQIVSDGAKGLFGRLTDHPAPKFEDTETTFAELQERIAKTIAYIETITPEDMADSAERTVELNFPNLQASFVGVDFLFKFVLPNFFFHLTTAYDILRHKGVEIGKRDYLGDLAA